MRNKNKQKTKGRIMSIIKSPVPFAIVAALLICYGLYQHM